MTDEPANESTELNEGISDGDSDWDSEEEIKYTARRIYCGY